MERKPEFADLPLAELLRRLAADISDLVRHEIRLAQAELAEKGRAFGKSVGTSVALFVMAGVLGFGAFVALTVTLACALALVMPAWAAGGVVTAAYLLGALLAVIAGRGALKKAVAPLPERTIASVKTDVTTIAASVRRSR